MRFVNIACRVCVAAATAVMIGDVGAGRAAVAAVAASPVRGATLGRGFNGREAMDAATRFRASDRSLFCVVALDRVYPRVRVRATLIAVQAGGQKNYTVLRREVVGRRVNLVHFRFTLPGDWPPGRYRVDLAVNNKSDRTLPFTIVK